MAQPRFKAPSLQELILAYQSGPKGGAELEAVRGGLRTGLGTGLGIQKSQEEAKERAQTLKLKLEEFQLEKGKAKEAKRATGVSEIAAGKAAKSKQALEAAKTEQAEAQAEFLRRKPGSARQVPKSDVDLDIQAEKDAQSFAKTISAGTGTFGLPNLPELKAAFKEQRLIELKTARDQEIESDFIRVMKADGVTGKVPKASLETFLQTFPGSKVIK